MSNKTIYAIVAVVAVIAIAAAAFMLMNNGGSDNGSDVKDKTVTVTDAAGRTVAISGNVERVACYGVGCLRLFCYGSDVNKIVGVEKAEINGFNGDESRGYWIANKDYFMSLKTDIGQGGPQGMPDKEKLLLADLDLLFITNSMEPSEIDELSKSIGCPVVLLSGVDYAPFGEAFYDSIKLVGKAAGTEQKANDTVSYLKSVYDDLKKRSSAGGVTAYICGLSYRGNNGIDTTIKSYPIFDALNITNAYAKYVEETGAKATGHADKISTEALTMMDPENIVIDYNGYKAVVLPDVAKGNTFYGGLSAFKNGNVVTTIPSIAYAANAEHLIATAYYLGSVYYPEKFADVSVEEKFAEVCQKILGNGSIAKKILNAYSDGLCVWNTQTDKVSVASGSSVTFTDPAISDGSEVFRGTVVSFKISGTGQTVKTTMNGEDTVLTAKNGVYSFKTVGDVVISVS